MISPVALAMGDAFLGLVGLRSKEQSWRTGPAAKHSHTNDIKASPGNDWWSSKSNRTITLGSCPGNRWQLSSNRQRSCRLQGQEGRNTVCNSKASWEGQKAVPQG